MPKAKKKEPSQPKYLVVTGEDLDFHFVDKMEDVSELFNELEFDNLTTYTGFDDHSNVNAAFGECTSSMGVVLTFKKGKIVPVVLDMETKIEFKRDYNSE